MEFLQCHDKILMDEKLLLMIYKKNGFLRWNLLLVRKLAKIVEMTTMDLEFYINLVYGNKSSVWQDSTLKVLLWLRYHYQTAPLHKINR